MQNTGLSQDGRRSHGVNICDVSTEPGRSVSSPTSEEIQRWLKGLLEPQQVVAIFAKNVKDNLRVFSGARSPHRTGYFTEPVKMVNEALHHSGKCFGVYLTLNPVNPERLSQRGLPRDDVLTPFVTLPSDDEIARRRLLLIDVDPIQESTIAATSEEKKAAFDRTQKIDTFLGRLGWPRPAIMDSGNGYYLLYRIDLPKDDEGLVQRVLNSLDARFGDPAVHVDKTVFNPARIFRFPGTMNCKGEETPDRPHRLSRMLSLPEKGLQVVRQELLEAIAAEAPIATSRKTNGRANANDAMSKNGHVNGQDLTPPASILADAKVYLDELPPAVQGQAVPPRQRRRRGPSSLATISPQRPPRRGT